MYLVLTIKDNFYPPKKEVKLMFSSHKIVGEPRKYVIQWFKEISSKSGKSLGTQISLDNFMQKAA